MSIERLQQAFELVERLDMAPSVVNPVTDGAIQSTESVLGVTFPLTYRGFLKKYGTFEHGDLIIFGLGVPSHLLPSVECAVHTARAIHPDLPTTLIPVHLIDNGLFACIDTSGVEQQAEGTEPPVVLWQATKSTAEQTWPQLADSFGEYLFRQVVKPLWHEKGFQVLKQHVQRYQATHEYDHAKGGKLPRNHEWRPYRFCIQDVLFGSTVVRHLREANCLQVDVFLTANIPEYDPLAGALALTSFLLSEAYKCGGTMEIRFTKNVEDGQVPQELQALAQRYDIRFRQAGHGRIEPSEAKALYAALTEFSPQLQQKINDLEQIGQVKMDRACYVVHHGVWTREQVEMIVLGSEYPDSILGGMAQPHQRHLYQHDLLHARAALLGGMLDRILARRERMTEDGITYDMEDDVRPLEIEFDGTFYAKRYHSHEDIPVPWLYPGEQRREIPGGMAFHVLIRARDAADLVRHLATDIQRAERLRTQTDTPAFVLVPYDFHSLPESFQHQMHTQAQAAKTGLLVCPEPILTLDSEASQKLARSRILRQ